MCLDLKACVYYGNMCDSESGVVPLNLWGSWIGKIMTWHSGPNHRCQCPMRILTWSRYLADPAASQDKTVMDNDGQMVLPIICQVLFWKCLPFPEQFTRATSQMVLCNNPSRASGYASPWVVKYQCQDGAGHMDSHVSALSVWLSGRRWVVVSNTYSKSQRQPSVHVSVLSLTLSVFCSLTFEVLEWWDKRGHENTVLTLLVRGSSVQPSDLWTDDNLKR